MRSPYLLHTIATAPSCCLPGPPLAPRMPSCGEQGWSLPPPSPNFALLSSENSHNSSHRWALRERGRWAGLSRDQPGFIRVWWLQAWAPCGAQNWLRPPHHDPPPPQQCTGRLQASPGQVWEGRSLPVRRAAPSSEPRLWVRSHLAAAGPHGPLPAAAAPRDPDPHPGQGLQAPFGCYPSWGPAAEVRACPSGTLGDLPPVSCPRVPPPRPAVRPRPSRVSLSGTSPAAGFRCGLGPAAPGPRCSPLSCGRFSRPLRLPHTAGPGQSGAARSGGSRWGWGPPCPFYPPQGPAVTLGTVTGSGSGAEGAWGWCFVPPAPRTHTPRPHHAPRAPPCTHSPPGLEQDFPTARGPRWHWPGHSTAVSAVPAGLGLGRAITPGVHGGVLVLIVLFLRACHSSKPETSRCAGNGDTLVGYLQRAPRTRSPHGHQGTARPNAGHLQPVPLVPGDQQSGGSFGSQQCFGH